MKGFVGIRGWGGGGKQLGGSGGSQRHTHVWRARSGKGCWVGKGGKEAVGKRGGGGQHLEGHAYGGGEALKGVKEGVKGAVGTKRRGGGGEGSWPAQ